jgi:predicted metal-dependent HD superfamily phosphohydrolase
MRFMTKAISLRAQVDSDAEASNLSDDIPAKFLARWQALAANAGFGKAKSKEIGDYLLAQYSGSDRHYHGLKHIVSILDGFEVLKAKFEQPIAAGLAIFFHDVIYDASRSDNEEQSAIKMKEKLRDVVDDAVLTSAAFSIEATKKHAATTNPDTNLILDLDMAILGQPWAVYEQYARSVMLEYLPVYGEDAYRQGRAKLFLEPTIARGNIFLTDDFKHLNNQAIRNMRREAEILKSGKLFVGQDATHSD